jgi:hypothetical protein
LASAIETAEVEGRPFTELIFFKKGNADSIQLAPFMISTTGVLEELLGRHMAGYFYLVPSERK